MICIVPGQILLYPCLCPVTSESCQPLNNPRSASRSSFLKEVITLRIVDVDPDYRDRQQNIYNEWCAVDLAIAFTMSSLLRNVAYKANCHCGKVKYTVTAPDIYQNGTISCNCSMCTRDGYMGIFVPKTDVVFHSGFDDLTSYNFATHRVTHKFCPTCSSNVLRAVDGMDRYVINVSNP